MAGAGRYALHLVVADGTAYDEITSDAATPDVATRRLAPLGAYDPVAIVKLGQRPGFRFSSLKVASLLTDFGVDGADAAGVELGYVERSQGVGFEAGGIKLSAAKALIVPDSLRLALKELAEVAYLVLPYSVDGNNGPLGFAAILPAGTPGVSEAFTLGAVTVGGADLAKPLSVNVQFGLKPEVLEVAGKLYGVDPILRAPREPVIEVVAAQMGQITAERLAGLEVGPVVVNVKRLSLTGEGFASSGHGTITAAKAFMAVTGAGANQDGDGTVTYRFEPRKEGANEALAISF